MDDRIAWVIERCQLLRAIGDELDETRPFEGLTIGTGIHLEPTTVALILTLQRGGAGLVATGNLSFAENEHAVGQSVLKSFMRITNLSTNGKRVTVFGYGSCGKGVAANFRNAHAIVAVVADQFVALT